MPRFFAALVAAPLLASCQTADPQHSVIGAPIAITEPAASAIAGDMASRFAEQIRSAGAATIKLQGEPSEYAAALEAALKGWGHTIVADGKAAKDQNPIELAYSIDSIDGQVFARLTTSSISLGRAYTPTATGATPTSPLSIMQRG